MATSDPPTVSQVADQLAVVTTRLARRLRQKAPEDVTPSQYSALYTLQTNEPMTLGEFASAEHLRPSSASGLVDRLEEAGLISRRPDDRDGRAVRIEVTDHGRRIVTRVRELGLAYLEEALRELADDELTTLTKALPILSRLVVDDSSERTPLTVPEIIP
jgi:DNA-binding MarR family transcriptional regulator